MLLKNKLLLKITLWIAALKTLGAWGVLIIALIDSAAVPILLDPLVAGYVYSHPDRAWLYCIAGAAGSAFGSLVPYALGRAGGEIFLLKRINQARMQQLRDRFEKQEFLALMVPAMLPPPTPFKLFVFSAGVFKMRVLWFLLAIASGRLFRFAILSALTIAFGPQIVSEAKDLLLHHLGYTLLGAVLFLIALYFIFRRFRSPMVKLAQELRSEGPAAKPKAELH